MARPIRILGIDPGLRRTGWGLIEVDGNRLIYTACGSVATSDKGSLAERLVTLHDGLEKVIDEFAPDDVAKATQEYQRITSAFPVTQTTTDNLRATVDEFRNIARRTATPRDALVYVSQVMSDFPQIELDSLQWWVERADGRPAANPPGGPSTSSAPAADGVAQMLELSGRVGAMRRSDYRAITAEVQRFANALRVDPAYRVVRTQLPFDVTSEGTLSGDIGTAAETGEAPRFTIVLARNLP